MPRRTRRLLICCLAAVLAVAAGGYLWLTRPAVLRARLMRTAQAAGWRVASLDTIRLLPWGTLRIRGLELTPDGSRAVPGVPIAARRVRLEHVRIRCSLADLLRGRVRPLGITAVGATIRLLRPRTLAAGEQRMRAASRTGRLDVSDWPPVRFSNVDLGIVDEAAPDIARRRWILRGQGRPERGKRPGYRLRLWQQRGAAATPVSALRQTGLLVEARIRGDALELTSDWIDDQMLRAVVPPDLVARLDDLDLRGLVRFGRVRIQRGRLRTLELRFDRVRCDLPIEPDAAPGRRFARLHDARGLLRLSWPADDVPPELHLETRGQLNDAQLRVRLAAAGLRRDDAPPDHTVRLGPLHFRRYRLELSLRGLTVPDFERHRDFVTSDRLPHPVRAFFEDYRPSGRLNAELTLEARGGHDATRPAVVVEGRFEAIDGSGRYRGFPYPLQHVSGSILVHNDGIEIEQIRGRHGSGEVVIRGHVNRPRAWTGFDLRIEARNAPLDETLYAALPPEFRSLWDRVDPVGLCDATIRVSRPDGSPDTPAPPPTVRLTVRVLGGSLAIADGRLTHARGIVTIDGPRIVLRPLSGFLGEMPVTLRGELRLDREHGRLLPDLTVEADDLRLARVLPVQLPNQPPLGELVFEARASAVGRIRSDADGRITQRYDLTVRDGSLTGLDGRTRWTNLAGRIVQNARAVQLDRLTGTLDGGTLRIDGTIPENPRQPASLDLRVAARDEHIERLLGAAIPQRWQPLRRVLGLTGPGSVRVHLRSTPGEPQGVRADVQLAADGMIPSVLPVRMRDVRAAITLSPSGFELHEARAARVLGGTLSLSGEGRFDRDPPQARLSARFCDVPLDDALLPVLPPAVQDLVARLALRGRADLWLDPLVVRGGPRPAWRFDGLLELTDADMFVGFDLLGAAGWIAGRGTVGPQGAASLDAKFHIDAGLLAGRDIRDWDGRLIKPTDQPLVVLDQVTGRFCDGQVSGRLRVRLDTHEYELACVLSDVSLPRLLGGGQPARSPALTGRLDGRIRLRGSTDDPSNHDGGGELRIRNAPLRSIPLAEPMARAARARKRSFGRQVRLARLKFAWTGTRLRFSEVELHTDRQRFVGTGWWDLASDAIGFELVEARPLGAPRVAVLSDLIEVAGQELIAYRISGTLTDAKVTIEPLHRLTGPIRKLLQGDAGQP